MKEDKEDKKLSDANEESLLVDILSALPKPKVDDAFSDRVMRRIKRRQRLYRRLKKSRQNQNFLGAISVIIVLISIIVIAVLSNRLLIIDVQALDEVKEEQIQD